jgi:tetratricopeptide (TPR) repeat protein
MVDLSKQLARAKQSLDRRNYDLAIEVCLECQEVDPANIDALKLLIEAANRKAKEGKKGFGGLGFSLSRDPQKALSAALRSYSKSPDVKTCLAVGDAAVKVFEDGFKGAIDVATLFYDEGAKQGLFNEKLAWNRAHGHFTRFQSTKDFASLDAAIEAINELARAKPNHPEAGRTLKNWEATRSMSARAGGSAVKKKEDDFQSQLASNSEARRNEVMNRVIRTVDDAKEVLAFIDMDLKESPQEKGLWQKKGDVLRRIRRFDDAIAAYTEAQKLDQHDFVISIRIGDSKLDKIKLQIQAAKKQGEDTKALQQQLLEAELAEFTMRAERQPTELSHKFNRGVRLFQKGEIDEAAQEFQRSLKDARNKKKAHYYLGHCFWRKNLLDLARDQFTQCASLIEDTTSDEFKEVLYSRAKLALALDDKDGAKADFTKLVEMDLGYRDAAQLLSQLRS